jgi:dUTP pyrophosphatase
MALVKVLLTHKDAKFPKYAKPGDAGADVYSVPNPTSYPEKKVMAALQCLLDVEGKYSNLELGDYILEPGETIMVDLGFKIELLPNWEMQVRSRSGLAKRGIVVANAPGTIDSGYRGPCMVLLRNNNQSRRILKPGTRVAQFVLKSAPQAIFEQVNELSLSERGEGGFGSTGVK